MFKGFKKRREFRRVGFFFPFFSHSQVSCSVSPTTFCPHLSFLATLPFLHFGQRWSSVADHLSLERSKTPGWELRKGRKELADWSLLQAAGEAEKTFESVTAIIFPMEHDLTR